MYLEVGHNHGGRTGTRFMSVITVNCASITIVFVSYSRNDRAKGIVGVWSVWHVAHTLGV